MHPAAPQTQNQPGKFRVDRWTKILLIVWVIVSVLTLNSHHGYNTDEDLYLVLGRSIAESQQYAYTHIDGSPAHKRLPPLLPVLIAPFFSFPLPATIVAAKALIIAFGIGTILLLRKAAGTSPWREDALVLLPLLFSYYVIYYAHRVLTEIPYLFFSVAAVMAMQKLSSERSPRWRTAVLCGVAIAAACFMRTIGVALLAGLFFHAVIDHRKTLRSWAVNSRWLLAATIVCLCVGLWVLRGKGIQTEKGSGASYGQIFTMMDGSSMGALVERVLLNARDIFLASGSLVSSLPPAQLTLSPQPLALTAIIVVIALFTALGYVVTLKRRRNVAEYYVAIYALIICLWVRWDTIRFFLPLSPWLISYFLRGVTFVTETWRTSPKRNCASIATAMICLSSLLATSTRFVPRELFRRPNAERIAFDSAMKKLGTLVSTNDLVLCELPHATSFFVTARMNYIPGHNFNAGSGGSIASARATWVVLDPWMRSERRKSLIENLQRLTPALRRHEMDRVTVLELPQSSASTR